MPLMFFLHTLISTGGVGASKMEILEYRLPRGSERSVLPIISFSVYSLIALCLPKAFPFVLFCLIKKIHFLSTNGLVFLFT